MNRPGTNAKPPLLLLVGMHRSGTSLLGNLLHAAGVAMPGPLITGDQHNPEGYFERADITDLQEQLLIALDRWWPGATGMLPLPNDWWQRPETQAAAENLQRLLEVESKRQPLPWAIKDPRSSLLLPLWKHTCQNVGIPLRLVLAVRNPDEVVSSLCARDADAAGMTSARAEMLWWHHNKTVLANATDMPLHVVSYSRWFSPGSEPTHQLRQLLQFCGLDQAAGDPAVLEQCLALVKPGLRHNQTNGPALHRASRSQRLHQALSKGELERALKLVNQLRRPFKLDLAQTQQWLKANLRAVFRRKPQHLFDTASYRQACRQPGLTVTGDPWRHCLETGLRRGLSQGPLCHPLWLRQHAKTGKGHRTLKPAEAHPWGAAAEALSLSAGQTQTASAVDLLAKWAADGRLSGEELRAIAALPRQPGIHQHPLASPDLKTPWRSAIVGGSWHSWENHALLQHLPLPFQAGPTQWCHGLPTTEPGGADSPATVVLHLQSVDNSNAQGLLLALAGAYVVDPDPTQVELLRRLGVNAYLISTTDPIRLPLDPQAARHASASLGLPAPEALATPSAVLCLGSAGAQWEQQLDDTCWCLPAFHSFNNHSTDQARELASWLQRCQLEGIQLVELLPPDNSLPFDGFAALARPNPEPQGWLPVQRFNAEITPGELREELSWRQQGCPPPAACITPEPNQICLWEHETDKPVASVCISLHDYADRITGALESVYQQTLPALELIVVDDASSDESAAVVLTWMQHNAHRFARALLLQHSVNGGLAAARNTAFRAARTEWCFVLDADNKLLPQALDMCLAVAQSAPPSTAVVHPLIHRINDPREDTTKDGPGKEKRSLDGELISKYSWQKHCFRQGNYVDAMALIRRSAWQHVGGYTHIPGGWEDYDFWCKLIDAGMHGVLCPKLLAQYILHRESMTTHTTARNQRPLSRILMQRHPWLQLPLAMEAEPIDAGSEQRTR